MPSHILKCKMYAMSDCGKADILIFTQLWKKLEKNLNFQRFVGTYEEVCHNRGDFDMIWSELCPYVMCALHASISYTGINAFEPGSNTIGL